MDHGMMGDPPATPLTLFLPRGLSLRGASQLKVIANSLWPGATCNLSISPPARVRRIPPRVKLLKPPIASRWLPAPPTRDGPIRPIPSTVPDARSRSPRHHPNRHLT